MKSDKLQSLVTRNAVLTYMKEQNSDILNEVKASFVDVKTAYDNEGVTYNPFNKQADAFKGFMENEETRDVVIGGCSLGASEASFPPLERIRAFRKKALIPSKVERFLIRIDCDACKTSRVVPQGIVDMYYLLWSDIIYCKDIEHSVSADTMNSFLTLFKRFAEEPDGRKVKNKYQFASGKSAVADPSLARSFDLFAYLTHTAGNFIICYGVFNGARYQPTMDFWDLTLEGIREWFLDGKCKSSKSLNAALDKCEPWLNSFKGEDGLRQWEEFIRVNLLWPYVEEDKAKSYFVKPFFDGHLLKSKERFPTKKQAIKCLDEINACIIARGNLIRRRLLQMHNSPGMKESWEKINSTRKLLFNE